MKKLLTDMLLGCLLVGMAGCTSDQDPLEDGNRRDPEKEDAQFLTVPLKFGGDFFAESEEPLVRAAESNTYVGINVTRHAASSLSEEQYACGVFTKLSDIDISLESGYIYSFEASILINGRDRFFLQDNNFREPFLYNIGYDKFSFSVKEGNKFSYAVTGDQKKLNMLGDGAAMVDISQTSEADIQYCCYPRVERYYGTAKSYDPAGNTSGVIISMKYKSFALKFVVQGIPENSYLTCRDITNPSSNVYDRTNLVFPSDFRIDASNDASNPWKCVYSLNKLKSDDPQKLNLEFTLHQDGQADKTFKAETSVRANRTRVLNLNIDEGGSGSSGNVRLPLEPNNTDTDQDSQTLVYSGGIVSSN